jgi:hypothetical protein
MKNKLKWGLVIIIKGKYAGRLAYYDDDCDDYSDKEVDNFIRVGDLKKGKEIAVVYLTVPIGTPYILLPFSYIRNLDEKEENLLRYLYYAEADI